MLRAHALHGSHQERAFLSLAVFGRYTSRETTGELRAAERLLGEEAVRRARVTGLAIRLGATLSGGVPGVLDRFSLRPAPRGGALRLECRGRDRNLLGEVVLRRFDTLARLMGLSPELRLREGDGAD